VIFYCVHTNQPFSLSKCTELQDLRLFKATQQAKVLLTEKSRTIKGSEGSTTVLVAKIDAADKESQGAFLDAMAPLLDKTSGGGAAVFTAVSGDSLSIFALVGKAAQAKVKAGDLIKELGPVADAKGGGRPDRAQAGSKAVDKEQAVLAAAEALLAKVFG
jgi:alanyl-tRNA synthetase